MRTPALIFAACLAASATQAQDAADLAREIANPLADVTLLPFQLNYDRGYGPDDDGYKYTLNIQPVIPFELGGGTNLITRTIIPVVYQDEIAPGAGSQFGLGDTLFSAWYSPAPSAGLTWGAGVAASLPTGTDDLLSSRQWGLGPTALVVYQTGNWTVGGLANHLWSIAGDNDRPDLNNTFLQPFLSYNTETAWTYTLTSESSYNWTAEAWSVPLNVNISKLVLVGGKLPVSIGGGVGYWLDGPETGPSGFRARFQLNFVLPSIQE